ncbi:hypothetical protein PHPALM_28066 [Phytophthora palmivora]|uniref:CCHC-type domain-containing protein n=1 Tax=Phytophthora palmivora TaxID=4796 RepID=A0A2P4XB02_9STRA|nr:hypothetical protein PHPALM_28066 [Phytophthora palmivora]
MLTPSPKVLVSTWIDRVDLALQGAAESGRGKWSDKALYFILGNKLMENASKWWVDMDRRTPERKRTWTHLKKALLRRYGEKRDKSKAEWRVSMRRLMLGETYADFAAGLRDVVGRNRVSERVLLAQFYGNLDKTTKKLVKQRPKPRTLEEAVEKATEIDDPMDNVVLGMVNIGKSWATAHNRYFIPMDGTTGQTSVIPGVSGVGLDAIMAGRDEGDTGGGAKQAVALFINPQGVYNEYSGTWDPPPGHLWNGKYWYEPRKTARKTMSTISTSTKTEARKSAAKQKLKREKLTSSSDSESEEKPRKKRKAAVKQIRSVHCTNGPKCYACNKYGHLAQACTDADAKAKNMEYLERLEKSRKQADNTNRAP